MGMGGGSVEPDSGFLWELDGRYDWGILDFG